MFNKRFLKIVLFMIFGEKMVQPDRPQMKIQGVTGGMCETSGECSLGQTIPI